MQRNNSFLYFLNIILGLLLVGSLVFFYLFSNIGGIGLKELNENYIAKKDLKFSSLPKHIQKKYINRTNIKSKISDVNMEKIFDEDGNPINQNIFDYKDVIDSLNDKISFLEKENILLESDKNELAKMVDYEKSKNSIVKKKLLTNNLEKINDAEQQHYKNISELTQKINDLHRENIELSQQLNQKNSSYKDNILSLKKDIKQIKLDSQKKEEDLSLMYEAKLSSIKSINKSLNIQISELNNRLDSKNSIVIDELNKKDKEIAVLESKIHSMQLEKNRILSKNSQDILKIEKENSKKLQEFNEIVKNSTSENRAIQKKYKDIVKRMEEKFKILSDAQKNEIDTLSKKLKAVKIRNKKDMQENRTKLINAQKNSKIEFEKEISKKVSLIDELSSEVNNLKNRLDTLKNDKVNLENELKSKKGESSAQKDKILQLQDKIDVLEANTLDAQGEVNKIIDANEKKHNSNYAIFNKKIANLELKIKNRNKNYENSIKILKNKIDKIESEGRSKDNIISKLNNTILEMKKEKSKLNRSESEKISFLEKSLKELNESIKTQNRNYTKKINLLNREIVLKNNELKLKEKDKEKLGEYVRRITALKKSIKDMTMKVNNQSSSNKPILLGKIECDDMISGNFKISSTCKAKVDSFLNKYSKNNFFEVIPIVGSGGFASLNKVQRDGRLGISDNEIKRLTRLSNIGLGRDRAKEGGWLIHEKFGEDVRVSYTVYSIESKNKRGFVIRVYK